MHTDQIDIAAIEAAIARHEKIALQYSGGKDSRACLHLLRDYLDKITVYFLDSGDAFQESLELVQEVARSVPNFVRVPGRVEATISAHGFPSDIVPCESSLMGQASRGQDRIDAIPLLSRYECCALSIQIPMMERMRADGVTLIIRGQKNADTHKGPFHSGEVHDGIEFLYPIEHWTDDDVLAYLTDSEIELPRFYQEGLPQTPSCMKCSAWWDAGDMGYMKRHHPTEYAIRLYRIDRIMHALSAQMAQCERGM